jgi:hypothetical protein
MPSKARKLKGFVCVHENLLRHRKVIEGGLERDRAALGVLVATWLFARDRHADKLGDSFPASSDDVQFLAGTRPLANALKRFERLREFVRVERTGAGFRIHVRNYSKRQFGRDVAKPEQSDFFSVETETSAEAPKRSARFLPLLRSQLHKKQPRIAQATSDDHIQAWFDYNEIDIATWAEEKERPLKSATLAFWGRLLRNPSELKEALRVSWMAKHELRFDAERKATIEKHEREMQEEIEQLERGDVQRLHLVKGHVTGNGGAF